MPAKVREEDRPRTARVPLLEMKGIKIRIYAFIHTFITFDGTLSTWWTKIVVGFLLFAFIALQKFVSRPTWVRGRIRSFS